MRAHHVKRMLQVRRIVRGDDRGDMRARVPELELHRVQPLALQPQFLTEPGIRPVHRVTHKRVPDRREMHTDLVRTTGLEIDRSECRLTEPLYDIPMRHRVFARWRHAEPEIGDLRAPEPRRISV